MASDTESVNRGFQSIYLTKCILQISRLKCIVCNLKPRDPAKCPNCGAWTCLSCQRECRKCKDNIHHSEMVRDEEMRREIDRTTVQCWMCYRNMSYQEYIEHNTNCQGFLPEPALF